MMVGWSVLCSHIHITSFTPLKIHWSSSSLKTNLGLWLVNAAFQMTPFIGYMPDARAREM